MHNTVASPASSPAPRHRRRPLSTATARRLRAKLKLATINLDEFKPRLRGWIHAGMVPIALAAGIVLIALAPGTVGKVTTSIYAVTGLLLFSVSAVYHRGNWSPRVRMILKRLDHTNIMLIIAGSYTPLAAFLLPEQKATWLLAGVWIGAIAGIIFRLFWTNAPRFLYVPVYIILGLAALLFIGDFFAASVPAAVLICAGGAAYIAGAVFYALKRPNLHLEWFGFHELFHAFTVGGFVCHYIAIMFAVLGA
ncbi:PAQR family membrane homeostasis protein TrhA [Zhihengliuella flava]|uniref:Hemolysin III n=1 Tax=Zhihengliuella flava TaxID=1285193 RepID=A0A931GI80_9MICC|nr:hemolysin III family protein [Zhihengliuella flava]MBG6083991.1 hemolysin III [Zhihengliuella flava]